MAGPVLGYIDELIRYLDSGKPIYQILGASGMQSRTSYVKPPKEWAADLAISPKYTLPVLGQFYRPVDELSERDDRKFWLYAEDYEIEMLAYPPAPAFVLEFSGISEKVQIRLKTDDVIVAKYVLYCYQRQLDSGLTGIGVRAFYYVDDPRPLLEYGWNVLDLPFILYPQPIEDRLENPKSGRGFIIPTAISSSTDERFGDAILSMVSSMWPELRALLQFLVILRVKNGVARSEVCIPRSKLPTRKGRYTGYTYHVLDIHPLYAEEPRPYQGGTHESPRFHLRRAHLRHFQDFTFTFIRMMRVGNPQRGIVEKDYNLVDFHLGDNNEQ